MNIIAILSQKGGAGKTTLAVNLAIKAELAGQSVLLIDLDPQASSAAWKDSRTAETPVVVSAPAARLPQLIETARSNGAQMVIIDTAPHSENSALEAAKIADLVIIPCRAGILDIRAIKSSLNICELARKPSLVVLNALPAQGNILEEAAAAITQIGGTVAKTSIGQRIAFNHAMTASSGVVEFEPNGKAAQEMTGLFTEITKHLKGSTHEQKQTQPRRRHS
jgi:chromosome partitioning protein